MRIDLADQHIKFRCAQFPLLIFDFVQKLPDIDQHLIIGPANFIQFRIRVQFDRPLKIIAVEFCHRIFYRLNRLCKSPGKIYTQNNCHRYDHKIYSCKHKEYGDQSLVQHPVRNK